MDPRRKGSTDSDGRLKDLTDPGFAFTAGRYRLVFDTKSYFSKRDTKSFYPAVTVEFEIEDSNQHYHVPLLVSPYGYSTYRGS